MFLISFYIKTSKEAVFCHIRPNSGLLSQKQKNSLIKLKSRQFSRYFQIFSDIKSRILVSLKKAKGRVFNRGQPGGLWMWYQIVTWNLLWWGCRWFGVLLCGFSTNRQRLWFKNFFNQDNFNFFWFLKILSKFIIKMKSWHGPKRRRIKISEKTLVNCQTSLVLPYAVWADTVSLKLGRDICGQSFCFFVFLLFFWSLSHKNDKTTKNEGEDTNWVFLEGLISLAYFEELFFKLQKFLDNNRCLLVKNRHSKTPNQRHPHL